MMKASRVLVANVMFLLGAAPALANDGLGSVALGELVLGKTDSIAMQKEVLEIGWKEIKVDYDFVNESDKDVTENIIFPLPEYGFHGDTSSYAGEPGGFRVEVDGKPITFKTHIVAVQHDRKSSKSRIVTPLLRSLGLSDRQIALFPWMQGFQNPGFDPRPASEIRVFTNKQLQELRKKGLFSEGDPDLFPRGEALWDVRVTYSWRQTFLAHGKVHVHHRYAPFVTAGIWDYYHDENELKSRFGADEAFLKVWRRYKETLTSPLDRGLPATSVAYILKTANTWKDGIRDFTLRIRKSRPQEIVSLKFPGTARRIDSKTLEFRHTNFRPTQDLDVYFGNVLGDQLNNDGSQTGEPPQVP